MTAKEKAVELYGKYNKIINDNELVCIRKQTYETDRRWIAGKQCALIACDEVLGYMGADRGTEFWQEVKQEIEKL
jgi:hypothetical protein